MSTKHAAIVFQGAAAAVPAPPLAATSAQAAVPAQAAAPASAPQTPAEAQRYGHVRLRWCSVLCPMPAECTPRAASAWRRK
jgi:hypothetical protein